MTPRSSRACERLRRVVRAGGTAVVVVSAAVLCNGMAAQVADAQPGTGSVRAAGVAPFSGTLQKIHESGVVRLGHRRNSPPFAFVPEGGGPPVGYSLDLCALVVETIGQELHRSDLRVEFVPVTPEDRFERVAAGDVDLECGSSTHTQEREARVGFSPTIFVTGTKLLVKRASPVRSLRDLDGRTVVLTSGTVQAEVVPRLAERQRLKINFVFAKDHDESLARVVSGQADAFANDDVQLYGLVATRRAAADLRVVGEFLTYADYALVLRKDDPGFAEVVQRTFARLAASSEVRAIYRRWFQQPLPSGVRLDIPMSPHLEHAFRLQGLAAD